uniref:Uncharacterized protein n=1 Tax=Arundo donax TaxID=35708 RepID=A0A0A9HT36_ARUDO
MLQKRRLREEEK